ncbi:MAG: hypothetical protein KDC33_05690 [Thermoleophilia bacterium]|nr:hypothetical protein [Thermoleophilia bacterium]
MPLFDAYLFVDWSSANRPTSAKPRRDAIWIGELGPLGAPEAAVATEIVGGEIASEVYVRTRSAAAEHARDRLLMHVERGNRVLVGFDFPYGYPAGFAVGLGLVGEAPWRAVWDELSARVADDTPGPNNSNRFEVAAQLNGLFGAPAGPFWGCGNAVAPPGLGHTMKGLFTFPLTGRRGLAVERLRWTEKALKGVQESWKLAYAGSVGSQAVLGIPYVRALRDDKILSPVSRVWPFESGFVGDPAHGLTPGVLHAEIWPGIVPDPHVRAAVEETGAIRDQAQVRLVCTRIREMDVGGDLPGLFALPHLNDQQRRVAIHEEGWILGAVPRP